jgi:hypothetical protein
MYGHGASSAETSRAGRTGMKMLAHFSGYKRLANALLARCSMAVWEDRKMILDSERANSNKATMLGIVKALKRA